MGEGQADSFRVEVRALARNESAGPDWEEPKPTVAYLKMTLTRDLIMYDPEDASKSVAGSSRSFIRNHHLCEYGVDPRAGAAASKVRVREVDMETFTGEATFGWCVYGGDEHYESTSFYVDETPAGSEGPRGGASATEASISPVLAAFIRSEMSRHSLPQLRRIVSSKQQVDGSDSIDVQSVLSEFREYMRRSGEEVQALRIDQESLKNSVERIDRQLQECRTHVANALAYLISSSGASRAVPSTFAVVPVPERNPVGANAPMKEKFLHNVRRVTEYFEGEFVSKHKIIFFVPVTGEPVPCGPSGDGYTLTLPKATLKYLVPALKLGFFVLKVALATQGLGGVGAAAEGAVMGVFDFASPAILTSVGGIAEGIKSQLLQESVDTFVEAVLLSAEEEEERARAGAELRESASTASSTDAALEAVHRLVHSVEAPAGQAFSSAYEPRHLGLVKAQCSSGPDSGRVAWVSAAARSDFEQRGTAAFRSASSRAAPPLDSRCVCILTLCVCECECSLFIRKVCRVGFLYIIILNIFKY